MCWACAADALFGGERCTGSRGLGAHTAASLCSNYTSSYKVIIRKYLPVSLFQVRTCPSLRNTNPSRLRPASDTIVIHHGTQPQKDPVNIYFSSVVFFCCCFFFGGAVANVRLEKEVA